MLQRINKIFNIIATIIVIVALIIIVYASLSLKNGNVPKLFGYSFMVVQTPSMEPTIMTGDFIITKEKDAYEKGDIISFYSSINGTKVSKTHRIYKIINDDGELFFETKGDNNPTTDDGLVNQSDIIGKLVYQSSFLGSLFTFKIFTNPRYLLPVLIVLLIIFIISQISNIVKILKEYKNE